MIYSKIYWEKAQSCMSFLLSSYNIHINKDKLSIVAKYLTNKETDDHTINNRQSDRKTDRHKNRVKGSNIAHQHLFNILRRLAR